MPCTSPVAALAPQLAPLSTDIVARPKIALRMRAIVVLEAAAREGLSVDCGRACGVMMKMMVVEVMMMMLHLSVCGDDGLCSHVTPSADRRPNASSWFGAAGFGPAAPPAKPQNHLP